jgi:Co/Zn/Cd efflux system component
MADCCCTPPPLDSGAHEGNAAKHRRVLWAVLALNAVMSVIEVGAGLAAGWASLQADALDFKGDSANYGITFSLLAWPYAIEHRLRWLRVQPWELLAS